MNSEDNRLNTFRNWPASAPVEPVRIAKAGFYYTGEGTEVQCFSCGGKISEWDYGDQVMLRHRRMAPNCQFVLNPSRSGNVPIIRIRPVPHPAEFNNSRVSWANEGPDDPVRLIPPTNLNEDDEMYRNDALRLLSFANWDDDSVSRESLAAAGFYHKGDRLLRCAWCGGELEPFRSFGSIGAPLEVHRMYFPWCEHAIYLATSNDNNTGSPNLPTTPDTSADSSPPSNNEPQSSGAAYNERILNMSGTWRSLGVVSGGARHPHYASQASRLASFERWPANRTQTPQTLAEAGFFHTGIDDQVRCFYCDGGLGKWEAGDAPWNEHARWFPHCGYVLLHKGQYFVDSCRQRTISAENGISRPRNQGANFPVIESQLEECMVSNIALAALEAGLDVARVRRAFSRRLRNTGLPFPSSEALIDAVLNEQLNEEAWTSAPRPPIYARDLLAESLRDRPAIITQQRRSDEGLSASSSSGNRRPITLQTRSILNEVEGNVNLSNDTQQERGEENDESSTPEKKSLTLEEENRQLKEAKLCKVCMDSEVSVVFLPCGHLVSCGGCGSALTACPLCRCPVKALVRAYLA